MIYLDANVFVNAAINEADAGRKSRELLTKILKGEQLAATSVLAIDETLWALQREKGKAFASEIAQTFFAFRNLQLIDATVQIAEHALRIYREEKLGPRDSTHLATMHAKGITTIISYDDDFDPITAIKRKTP